MPAWLLAAWLVAPVLAAEQPPEAWVCPSGRETTYWRSLRPPPLGGPQWGVPLADEAPAPFVWLAIYEGRDHDIAERRAPITQRWGEFTPERKCATLDHYAEQARRRKRDFEALVGWRDDEGLVRRLSRLGPDDVVAAQGKEPVKGLRLRFLEMRSWLRALGLDGEPPGQERAYGVLVRLSQLDTAYHDFLSASGHFRALAQERLAAALEEPGALARRLTEREGASAAATALLSDPAARQTVADDVASDMERGASTETALGAGFESLVADSLAGQLAARKGEAANAALERTQRSERERQAALDKAQRELGRLERRLSDGKLDFPGSADVQLLTSLEEYRRGDRALAEALAEETTADPSGLVARYLAMVEDVCRTHYRSMRYDPELIVTLCGPQAPGGAANASAPK